MTLKPSGRLRTAKALGEHPESDEAASNGHVGASFATLADLVADLIGPLEIVPRDRLAAAKARAGVGSLAEALVDEGHALGLHCDEHVRHSTRDAAWGAADTDRALARLA